MSKVILMCGRICSGKSTHARALRLSENAVILSVDEVLLTLFGQHCGNMHDTYVERMEALLFRKSVEIVETGMNVILDLGFWTRAERDEARRFYAEHGIPCEFHYIDISHEDWLRRLQKRNADILAGHAMDYYVDEALAQKFASIFEKPAPDEIDVWVKD